MAACWVYIVAVVVTGVSGSADEYRLVSKLMSAYDVNVLPSALPAQPVTVTLDLAIIQILDLNDRNQELTANYFLTLLWSDASLVWDPAEYGGIQSVRISVNRIWKPDITVLNDVSFHRRDVEKLYPAVVLHSGEITWYTHVLLSTSCSLDMTYFPWDSQECPVLFTPWTHSLHQLDLVNNSAEGKLDDFYREDGEWRLKNIPVVRYMTYISDPFPVIKYTVRLERKPLYYIYNLLLPCTFLTLCGMLVFLLPPESGEKVSMSVTMLLSSTVFLMVVAEAMPVQSDVIPLIGIYFICCLLLLVLSTVLSVLVLCVHHRAAMDVHLPGLVRRIVLDWLATALCMRATVRALTGNTTNRKNDVGELPDERTPVEPAEKMKNEWYLTARVLDRLFFCIFFTATLLTTSIVVVEHM